MKKVRTGSVRIKLEKLFIRCIMHQPCQQSMRAVIVKYQP